MRPRKSYLLQLNSPNLVEEEFCELRAYEFLEVWRHASSNCYFSRPMHALRRELLFRSSFQILYHALQHVDDRRVLLCADALIVRLLTSLCSLKAVSRRALPTSVSISCAVSPLLRFTSHPS